MSSAFNTIERKLYAKRSGLIKELNSGLDESESSDGISKDDFAGKRDNLKPLWQEVTEITRECINPIDGNESDSEDTTKDINNGLKLDELKLEKFFSLEAEIEKKINVD